MKIPCHECHAQGFLSNEWTHPGVRFNCQWCHGTKTIDTEAWVDYQPAMQRPKQFCDIVLRDGSVVKRLWPNYNQFGGNGKSYRDYRVVKVRLNQEWVAECGREWFDLGIPAGFAEGLKDFEAGRVVDMETALTTEPKQNPTP